MCTLNAAAYLDRDAHHKYKYPQSTQTNHNKPSYFGVHSLSLYQNTHQSAHKKNQVQPTNYPILSHASQLIPTQFFMLF
jgi:hypothetical protein